jgi:Derlin-2/3
MSSIEEIYRSIPPVTRTYVTLAVLTTLGCALEVVSPLKLYLSWTRIPVQPWRLLTNFTFFGPSISLDFIFHVFFLARYSRLLEETTFRGRSADYAWFLLVCGTLLTLTAPFVNVLFMGPSLTFAMVYLWSRRNESVSLSFLGLVNFSAPFLPWLLLLFTVLFGASATVDLLGIAVGHVYYFLSDVYPSLTGCRLLETPRWFAAFFGPADLTVPFADAAAPART